MIKFFLIVNKRGCVRVLHTYDILNQEWKTSQADILKRTFSRDNEQSSFFDFKDWKIVYRKYSSLYCIFGVDEEENELAILELIQLIVETLNDYIGKMTELDIMFNIDKVYMILDEIISNGTISETSNFRILSPLQSIDNRV